jgi:hypothetical protein
MILAIPNLPGHEKKLRRSEVDGGHMIPIPSSHENGETNPPTARQEHSETKMSPTEAGLKLEQGIDTRGPIRASPTPSKQIASKACLNWDVWPLN